MDALLWPGAIADRLTSFPSAVVMATLKLTNLRHILHVTAASVEGAALAERRCRWL
jgi:hypothetical protein